MKRALLVGCSSGIGLATARALLRDGWEVQGVSRSASPLTDERYAHDVLDVASTAYTEALAALVGDRGPFDVCIYFAGVGDRFDTQRIDAETRTFEVNVMGAVRTAEIVLPTMIAKKSGHFVALSSLADALVSGLTPSYNASKAAVTSYFEGLARALRGTGVSVTNVRFGFVDTKMAKSPVRPFMMSADAAAAVVVRALAKRPRRVTRPFTMAALVAALAMIARVASLFA